jgi:hypothetical protein
LSEHEKKSLRTATAENSNNNNTNRLPKKSINLAMPIEINWLRDYKGGDPEKWRESQRKRFRPVEWVDETLALDKIWRDAITKIQDIRKEINKFQKEVITPKKKAGQPCDDEVAKLKMMEKEVRARVVVVVVVVDRSWLRFRSKTLDLFLSLQDVAFIRSFKRPRTLTKSCLRWRRRATRC